MNIQRYLILLCFIVILLTITVFSQESKEPTPVPTILPTPTHRGSTDAFYSETAMRIMSQRDRWAEDIGIEKAVQKTVEWLNGNCVLFYIISEKTISNLPDKLDKKKLQCLMEKAVYSIDELTKQLRALSFNTDEIVVILNATKFIHHPPEGIVQAKVDDYAPTVIWIKFTDGTVRFISSYPIIVDNTSSLDKPSKIIDAVKTKDLLKVKELITKDPNLVNDKDGYGRTPLHFAAENGLKEIAEFLVSQGADVNRNSANDTPLHLAVLNGSKEIVELLISNGANIDAKDNNGKTPLHLAVWKGSKEIVELLINKGADINAKTNSGKTILQFSEIYHYKDIKDMLIKYGAQE